MMTPPMQARDEYGIYRRVKAAFIILPLLGIIGGMARAFGLSESGTAIGIVTLLVMSFLATVLQSQRAERDEALLAAEFEMWRATDVRLQAHHERSLAEQKALIDLLRRQQNEAEELERQKKELAKKKRKLARQHKKEYEEFIKRRHIA